VYIILIWYKLSVHYYCLTKLYLKQKVLEGCEEERVIGYLTQSPTAFGSIGPKTNFN